MSLNFPSNPAVNQTYSFGTRTWRWNGTGWQLVAAPASGSVGSDALAPDSVTPSKIPDGSLTAGKFAPGEVSRMVRQTAKAASGSSVEFTGIPEWARRVVLLFHSISTSGTSGIRVQLGTETSYETSSYVSVSDVFSTSLTPTGATDGFQISDTTNTTDRYSGTMTITNITDNTWIAQCVGARATSSFILSAGSKELAGVLTRLRVTGGTSFDAGTMNIIYEG